MRTLFLSLSFLLVLAAPGRAQESQWIADARSGCRMWSLTPAPEESIAWDGRCVGGYGQGHGVLKWYVRGALWETDDGEFAGGMLNGHATLIFANGERFDGAFRDHLANGQGTLRTGDNEIYSGLWTNGCFDDGKRRKSFGVRLSECKFVS